MRLMIQLDGVIYCVDAEYFPSDPWDRDTGPGGPEGFDIGQVYEDDGITVADVSDEDVERIEQLLLDDLHERIESDDA